MLDDLDATIKKLVGLSPVQDLNTAVVSFIPPDKDFKVAVSTVNFFLCAVQENHALRASGPVTTLVNGSDPKVFERWPPAVRMDCTYLVTAWATSAGAPSSDTSVRTEHRLLGLALAWLSEFRELKDSAGFDVLVGALKTSQLNPLLMEVAQQKDDHYMGQFWTALGIAPRPSFLLTVTIAIPPRSALGQRLPAVESRHVDVVSVHDPVLIGRVGRIRDRRVVPVAGARVAVVGTDKDVTSDPRGYFSVAGLSFGPLKLHLTIGNQQEDRDIEYKRNSQVHNIILTGP